MEQTPRLVPADRETPAAVVSRPQPSARRGFLARRGLGLALVLSSAVAFGAMPGLARVAYAHGASSFTLLSIRFALAWVVLAFVTRRGAPAPRGERVRAFLLGLAGYGGASLGFFTALQFAPASVVSVLMYTYPALVTLASAVERRRMPSPAEGLAVGAAIAGAALVVGLRQGQGGTHGLGIGLALLASVSYAAFVVVGGRLTARLPAPVTSRAVIGGAGVAALGGAVATGSRFSEADAAAWGIAAILGVLCTAYAITALLAGIARVGPTAASVLSAAEPLTAVFLASAALGEPLTPSRMAGAGLVVLAVVLVSMRQGAHGPERRAEPGPAGSRPARRAGP